jgi:hypothetical protein
MTDGWQFHRDPDGEWRWKYIMHGRTVAQARRGYKQYSACVDEARVHGYGEHVSAASSRPARAHEVRAKGKKT